MQARDFTARLFGVGGGALANLIQGVVATLLDQQLLLALQSQLGCQFVFLDRALLFHRLCTALKDGFVGLGLNRFARWGL